MVMVAEPGLGGPSTYKPPKITTYNPNTGISGGGTPAVATSTRTSGGGGGGGGIVSASIDYTQQGAYYNVQLAFADWMGWDWVNSHRAVIDTAFNQKWSAGQIQRESMLKYGGGGPMAEMAWAYVRSEVGFDVPASLIQNIVANGIYTDAKFADFYAPALSGDGLLQNPNAEAFITMWNEYTAGANFGPTAQNKLIDLVKKYGWQGAQVEWQAWLPTTHSATSGNYGANKRETLRAVLTSLLHREPTDAELAKDGPYWKMVTGDLGNLNTTALVEQIRQSEEYAKLYPGKPAYMNEGDYWAWKQGIDSVGNWWYNDTPNLPSGGAGGSPELTPEGEAAMKRAGFTSYAEWAKFAGGDPGWFQQRALDSGWITLEYGQNDFTGWTPEEYASLMAEGWNASNLRQHFETLRDSIINEGTYNPVLEEAFGSGFTSDEWYVFTNGGKGSAELRLKLMEAQNKVEFREAFRNYTGHDPGPQDYDFLSANFVSPSEYAHRMAAKESAAEMLPQANELLNRIYGNGTTLSELENLAMNGQGSGALRAQLDQAARLDQYRWTHKQKYGTEPTPADYARYAGYAGPAELQWELNLAESIDEFGPDVQETWKKMYNEDISDESLRIMFGDMKGAGELKYKYKKAKEQESELEQAHEAGFTTPGAMNLYSAAKQGGFKESMAGLADMN